MNLTESITENFTFKEFIVSDDRPDLIPYCYDLFRQREKINTIQLVHSIIQPIREKFKEIMTIKSGFRPPILNQAIGGAQTSDHLTSLAADFTCENLIGVYYWAYHTNLPYRQIILYPNQNFIHVSINTPDKEYKHEALIKWDGNSKYLPFTGSKLTK